MSHSNGEDGVTRARYHKDDSDVMPAARIFLQLIADFVVYLGLLPGGCGLRGRSLESCGQFSFPHATTIN
jgi:hypothetical protein